MKIADIKKSRYLAKNDIGAGLLGTIKLVKMENVAPENQEASIKPVVYFTELEKPLVCNCVNFEAIASISKQEDSDNWAGTKIVMYFDENVIFGGKRCGGIRVRAPKMRPATATAPKVAPVAVVDTVIVDDQNNTAVNDLF